RTGLGGAHSTRPAGSRPAATRPISRVSLGETEALPPLPRREARHDLGRDLLELTLRVLVVADRVHDEAGAAGFDESFELLGALGGGADDPVLPGQRAEVLRIARAQEPHPGGARLLVVVADGDEGQVRVHEAIQRAPGVPGLLADPRHRLGVALGVDDVGDPPVTLTAGADERRLGAAADPDRRPGPLDRPAADAHRVELREAAVDGGGRVTPERAHDLDGLRDAGAALTMGHAAHLELLRV